MGSIPTYRSISLGNKQQTNMFENINNALVSIGLKKAPAPVKKTVADIVAPVQTIVDELFELVLVNETQVTANRSQIESLEKQNMGLVAEADLAEARRQKFLALLQ